MSCPTVIRVTTQSGPPGIGLPEGSADAGKIVQKDGSTPYLYRLVTPGAASLPQALDTAASPTFAGLTIGGIPANRLLFTGTGGALTGLSLGAGLTIAGGALVASGGATNLSYTASPTGGTVVSSTGDDAPLPLADATNAGLLTAAEKALIASALQAGQAFPLIEDGRNASGSTLTIGTPVYVPSPGSSGTRPLVAAADASSELTAARTLGLMWATAAHNSDCKIITRGILPGVNTSALTEGAAVWLSETTGQLTSTRPTQPAHGVFLGFCIKSGAGTSGILYVNVINGEELEELHDVLISGATAGQVLRLAADGLWKNATLTAADVGAATAAQGALAVTAVQPAALGTAASRNVGTTAGTVAAGDDSRFAELKARLDAFRDAATFWVSKRISASNSNNGTSEGEPFLTIGAAVAAANAYVTANPNAYAKILVGPGVYVESGLPFRLQPQILAQGSLQRGTIIKPATGEELNGFFALDSGCMVVDFRFAGHQATGTSPTDSSVGQRAWAIRFNEQANGGAGVYLTASPYVKDCASITAEDDAGLAGSTSTGDTGGGVEIDGAKCRADSPIRSMVVYGFTQQNLGGPGCVVKNEAYAELVSFFGLFGTWHVQAERGGQATLSGGGCSEFGTYGLVADGYSATALFTGSLRVAATAGATTVDVISMTANRLGSSSRPAAGQIMLLGGVAYVIQSGTPINASGTVVADTDPTRAGYRCAFYNPSGAGLAGNVPQGATADFRQRSQISAGCHSANYVGSGTNYSALPWNGGVPVRANEVVERNLGRVFGLIVNDVGDVKVAGGAFAVDGTTGSVTINTSQFNLSGLNAIGPFSRNGGISNVGVQLQEVSNDVTLLASTGTSDGNTAPTQFAVRSYADNRFLVGVTATAGQPLTISDTSTQDGSGFWTRTRNIELSMNTANGLVQLDGTGRLPAVDGSQLTGLPATDLDYVPATRTVTSSTGADAVLTLADGVNAGLMSSADYLKLLSLTFGVLPVPVYNNTGATIAKGVPVYVTGSSGTRITIAPADASVEATAARTIGLTSAAIANNSEGTVIAVGPLDGLNTSTLAEGQIVYLSETTGGMTTTRPTQPAHSVVLGICIKQAAGAAGIIDVRVDNGLELEELHDVLITGKATGQALMLAADGIWKNRLLVAADLSDSSTSGRAVLTGTPEQGRSALQLGSAAQAAATDFATPAALASGLAGKADLVGGVVPSSQIPAIAISDYLGSVSSQSAMLALTGQRGDWCIRTDGGSAGAWILSGEPSSLLANWVQIPMPPVPVQSVNGQVGVVTLGAADVGAAPAAHAQAASTISDFTSAARATVSAAGSLSYNPLTGVFSYTAPTPFDPASPGAIGGTTAAAGTFTAGAFTQSILLPSAAPGTPAAGHLYRVADTLRYRDSGAVERLLLNAADNLANVANAATALANLGGMPLTFTNGTITYAATVDLDMAARNGTYQTISLTGNLTLTTSNRAAGRTVTLRLICDATQRNLTVPAGWVFVGTKPSNIAASKTGVLSLTFFGTADADCVAAYGVQS